MNWYKTSQTSDIENENENENKKEVISFDFDSTIVKYEWDETEIDFKKDFNDNYIYTINMPIVNLMKEAKASGATVYIVSSRLDKYKSDIEDVVKEYGINVDGIYCTNGQNKAPTLKRLGVIRHYDDDSNEINLANKEGIEGIQVY